jgi:hypothetical protein
MLSALSEESVDFLLVGAFALSVYGVPRATGDMGLWIRPSPENAARAHRALARFGAPVRDLTVADLASENLVFQIGVSPCRIGILTSIDGVAFAEAWEERHETSLAGICIPVVSRRHLIQNKQSCRRPKDLADIALLNEAPDGGD